MINNQTKPQNYIVSIVVATYNRSHFLSGFLKAIEKQTYPDWEAVVVDNNSEDDTPEVVREFSERSPGKIKHIRMSENVGFTPAIEEGFRQSKGDFLMFMGDDDLIMPELLEKSIAEFKRNPELGLVFTNMWFGIEPGEKIYFPKSYKGFHDQKLMPEEFLDMRIWGKTISAQATVFPKKVYKELGGFKYNEMQDTDFFFRASTSYPIKYIPEILAFSRKHDDSLTHQKYEEYARIRLDYWKEKLNTGSACFRRRLKSYLAKQFIRQARHHLTKEPVDFKKFREYIFELFSNIKFHTSLGPYYHLVLTLFPESFARYIDSIKSRLYKLTN